jgi:hypothetical protein
LNQGGFPPAGREKAAGGGVLRQSLLRREAYAGAFSEFTAYGPKTWIQLNP